MPNNWLTTQLRQGGVTKKRRGKVYRQRPPLRLERSYGRDLVGIINKIRDKIYQSVVPSIPSLMSEAGTRQDAAVNVGWTLRLRAMMGTVETAYQEITAEESGTVSSYGNSIEKTQAGEVKRQLKSMTGIDMFLLDDVAEEVVRGFILENIGLIKSLKSGYISDAERVITDGIRNGARHEQIAKDLQKSSVKAKNRAKLIARDQVNKAYGQLNKARQQSLGLETYIWRTSGDERVRPKHRNMSGRVCLWSDPTVYLDSNGKKHQRSGIDGVNKHPGQDIQCRCGAEARVQEILGDAAPKSSYNTVEKPPLEKKKRKKATKKKVVPEFRQEPVSPQDLSWAKRRVENHWKEEYEPQKWNPNDSKPDRMVRSVAEWVHDSNASNAVLMKHAAKEEFNTSGIVFNYGVEKPDLKNLAEMRNDIRSIYDATQAEFKEKGIKSVKLYRGLNNDVDTYGVIESWTTDKYVAEDFGTYKVIEQTVPVERILVSHQNRHFADAYDQSEYIVIN